MFHPILTPECCGSLNSRCATNAKRPQDCDGRDADRVLHWARLFRPEDSYSVSLNWDRHFCAQLNRHGARGSKHLPSIGVVSTRNRWSCIDHLISCARQLEKGEIMYLLRVNSRGLTLEEYCVLLQSARVGSEWDYIMVFIFLNLKSIFSSLTWSSSHSFTGPKPHYFRYFLCLSLVSLHYLDKIPTTYSHACLLRFNYHEGVPAIRGCTLPVSGSGSTATGARWSSYNRYYLIHVRLLVYFWSSHRYHFWLTLKVWAVLPGMLEL